MALELVVLRVFGLTLIDSYCDSTANGPIADLVVCSRQSDRLGGTPIAGRERQCRRAEGTFGRVAAADRQRRL